MHVVSNEDVQKEVQKQEGADKKLTNKVALITGGSRRIGAAIVRQLHATGMRVVIHYHHSETAAHALQAELNNQRSESALLFQADLRHPQKLTSMVRTIIEHYGRLDVLINNASTFYPTPLGKVEEKQWDDLLGTNLKAPFFLSQDAAPYLQETQGCIINLADIYAERPLKSHSVYSVAKAGVVMLTKTLARELGPQVRVNAIAPGAILWPEHDTDEVSKKRVISNVVLKRLGDPSDIAKTVLFLVRDAQYITGQIIAVDGGRTLNQ
jgi:pteridine reductase